MRHYQKAQLGGALIAIVLAVITVAPVMASEFQDTNNQLKAHNHQAEELQSQVTDADSRIRVVEAQITDTQNQISQTNAGIVEAKARMADSQSKLNELVRTEYQRNDQSKLELLVSAKNFSEYVDRETYIKSGQDKIAAAVNEIIKTRKELEAKGAELAKLNSQLASAQAGLVFTRAQAQNQLNEVNAVRDQLKQKLAKYRSGKVVNTGDKVQAGDLVGFEGTSGCSTGSHLHFEVQRGGQPVNPRSTIGTLRWPYDGGYGVNQEFGPANWAAPYSHHTGIDITQYFGAPVYAAASGTVSFSGYDRSGFGEHIKIDHGGGLTTIYGHMGARPSDYPNC